MLIVRYQLASGERGEDVVVGSDKWVFGRGGGDDEPTVRSADPRVSRTALVIRDSGPGPVVFRGQRGDAASVALLDAGGTPAWIAEGTAGNLTSTSHRVEMRLADEHVITIEVDFTDRGSVVDRQGRPDHEQSVANLLDRDA